MPTLLTRLNHPSSAHVYRVECGFAPAHMVSDRGWLRLLNTINAMVSSAAADDRQVMPLASDELTLGLRSLARDAVALREYKASMK
ncbi:hypothetical protein NUW54_g10579 [Trametes sanguinea]|uniref:Uncharacterized protein n=1 Tax=Trametes sanguinea TaxID=158606 RepID=A0ACC1NYF9_9APHY|nr:hypothetical protein NUW54_g10579 [Trametes sanguinea]